jgi:hypothetical protein
METMTADEPPYLGSWKGLVLKAIIIDDVHTWNGLRQATKLSPNNLNTALSELYRLGLLHKLESGRYSVSAEITIQYRTYYLQQITQYPDFRWVDGEPMIFSEEATTSLSDLTSGYDQLRATFTPEQTRLADQSNLDDNLQRLINLTQRQTDIMAEQSQQNREALREVQVEAKNNRRNFFIAIAVAVFEAVVTFIALFR